MNYMQFHQQAFFVFRKVLNFKFLYFYSSLFLISSFCLQPIQFCFTPVLCLFLFIHCYRKFIFFCSCGCCCCLNVFYFGFPWKYQFACGERMVFLSLSLFPIGCVAVACIDNEWAGCAQNRQRENTNTQRTSGFRFSHLLSIILWIISLDCGSASAIAHMVY